MTLTSSTFKYVQVWKFVMRDDLGDTLQTDNKPVASECLLVA